MDWSDARKPPYGHVEGPVQVRVVENGPVRVAIEIVRETAGSKYVQQVRLSAGSAGNQVEVENKIDWQTPVTALKASFPLTTGNAKGTYDLQVGTIERGNNDPKKYEVPQHLWFDLTRPDSRYGVAVLNDSKYGSDKPDDDTMRLTLLYTPGVRGGYQDQATQDFGRHDIRYAIAPHAGDWRQGDVPWLAKRYNRPLLAFAVPAHPGALGRSFSLISTNSRQVEVLAVKKAEDSGEIIVRLRELQGKPATGVQVAMAGKIVAAREVNGQESPVGAATIVNGALRASVPANGLKTFAIKLAAPSAKVAAARTQAVTLPFDLDAASRDSGLTDGAFDASGRTYPGEQLPATVVTGAIPFRLGSTASGAKNALTSRGQTIPLPAGYTRVYVLAASSQGDVPSQFTLGNRRVTATVQDWGGYIGQWDNRLWIGTVPELTYDWNNPWGGLEPGFIKKSEVAWFSSHRHHPKDGNEFYQYSYLFKYGFDVPRGATSITLPNDPRIKVFAVTAARAATATAVAVSPLYDALDDRAASGAPRIALPSGPLNDVTNVTVEPPLYWRTGGLRYTLDGSDPTPSSRTYTGPLELNDRATLKVAEVDASGKIGPVASAVLDIRDTTAPKLTAAEFLSGQSQITLKFSERLEKSSAGTPANYRLGGEAKVTTATLANDGRSVTLALDRPLPAGNAPVPLTVSGVRDDSPGRNTIASAAVDLVPLAPVFTLDPARAATTARIPAADLPAKARDRWTLNLFVKTDRQPENRTLIAGFGRARDGAEGTGRYLTKFGDGIRFWSANRDVVTNVPLDVGKWQMLTATYDGSVLRVYKNGDKLAEKSVDLSDDRSEVNVKPVDAWEGRRVLSGDVRDMTIWEQSLTPEAVRQLWEQNRPK
jgi:alpha-mannosidase